MMVWILPEDIYLPDFVVLPHPSNPKPLIRFHTSLVMGCMKAAHILFYIPQTVIKIVIFMGH